MRSDNGDNRTKKSPEGKVRLNGGPAVKLGVLTYFREMQKAVAKAESLDSCSMATLLTRIVDYRLDLSIAGLDRQKRALELYDAMEERDQAAAKKKAPLAVTTRPPVRAAYAE